jgi:hypothetical protein
MLGRCPSRRGLHGSRIMALAAGGRPAWLRRWPARLAWVLWALVVLGLAATPSLDQLARQAGRTDLGSNATMVAYGLVAVSAATVGTLLGGRRPRHPVGWLLLALGLWFIYGYASWVLLAWRGAPPAVGLALLDANVMVIPALIGLRAAADPDRVAAFSEVALVGQGRGNRTAVGVGVVGAEPVLGGRPGGRQPAGCRCLGWSAAGGAHGRLCGRWGFRSRWAPGRWSCVTVAPVGWSASSCAG